MNFLGDEHLFSPEHTTYVRAEPADVAAFRTTDMGKFPWPSQDNPMLAYLLACAKETAATEGQETALTWLAVHAWFEGALAAMSRASTDDEISMPTKRETIHLIARQMGTSEATAEREVEAIARHMQSQRRQWIEGKPLD